MAPHGCAPTLQPAPLQLSLVVVSLWNCPQGKVLSCLEHVGSLAEDDRGQRPHRHNLFGYVHWRTCRCVGSTAPGCSIGYDQEQGFYYPQVCRVAMVMRTRSCGGYEPLDPGQCSGPAAGSDQLGPCAQHRSYAAKLGPDHGNALWHLWRLQPSKPRSQPVAARPQPVELSFI
jgi:hypothetical protein